MKNLINILLFLGFAGVISLIIYKQNQRSKHVPEFLLGKVSIDNIEVERRVKGKILPAEEVKVKSKINGVVREIFIEDSDKVKKGQQVASIQTLAEPVEIENLKSVVKVSSIQFEASRLVYEREKKLFLSGLLSKADFETVETQYKQAEERLHSAEKKLQMATTGVITTEKELSNIIYAPAAGTVLSLNCKIGSPVIKQNNYNEGTTIATIANMDSLMFLGKIMVKDLSKIKVGDSLKIETTLIEDTCLTGIVTKVFPKGEEQGGIVKFPIEAYVEPCEHRLWGGVNATAHWTLEKRENVPCLEEKYLRYEGDSCFVWRKFETGEFLKSPVKTGLSDGLKTEIVEGVEPDEKVKLPEEV